MIGEKLFVCSSGDAEVVEERTHVKPKGLVVAIERDPSGG
jgi:hypothetical protein